MEKIMETKIAHLSFIQGVINRMGNNSFLLKGWCVTLVAAIFALASKDSNEQFVLVAYFPAFMFWFLDAFFLHQEKLYRELYKKVANNQISSDNFTLETSDLKNEVPCLLSVMFSKTLFPFYGILISAIVFVMAVLIA